MSDYEIRRTSDRLVTLHMDDDREVTVRGSAIMVMIDRKAPDVGTTLVVPGFQGMLHVRELRADILLAITENTDKPKRRVKDNPQA